MNVSQCKDWENVSIKQHCIVARVYFELFEYCVIVLDRRKHQKHTKKILE